jgi:uncharacterized damage-inducible protein DinB
MREVLILQAEANRYINRSWLSVLRDVSFDVLDAPRGAFFGSIFGTWNHILLGDRIWLGRLTGRPFAFQSLKERPCADWATLERERARTDEELLSLVQERADLAAPVSYRNAKGEPFAQPFWELMMHLFAHEHHHRGQISQMCHELKIDIPDGGLIGYLRQRAG